MGIGFIFPGQGSQFVGMGVSLKDNFPCARLVFEEVEDALSFSLFRLMREGPEDELRLTEHAQPALLSVSACILRILRVEGGISVDRADYLAGHSLGEYSALYASGVFSLRDAVRLVHMRGRAMQSAVLPDVGLMAAIMGLDMEEIVSICALASSSGEGICVAANDNAPGQIVISGDRLCVEHALSLASSRGAGRVILLPVSAPFHSPLMAPACRVMEEELSAIEMNPPLVPVIANITGSVMGTAADMIRDNLVCQITGMVHWRSSMETMISYGVDRFYELGSGRVLCGLLRRISRDVSCSSVGCSDSISSLLKEFS